MTGNPQAEWGLPENPYQAPRQSDDDAPSTQHSSRLAAAWAGARSAARPTAKWTLIFCGGLIAVRWLTSVGYEAYRWCKIELGVEELLWSVLQQIFFLFASVGMLLVLTVLLAFVAAIVGGIWHALRWQLPP